ncbi:MAG TPA: hypothetical protein VME43_25615 [Bryobacteraceae bacterium]|nr:hypothetical protein [Bryobacteraceae bacterium]
MRYRLLAGVLAVCLAALGQTLSVSELAKFLQSSVQLKMTDKEVAGYLGKVKLNQRLDDRTIEEIQGYGIGPKTVAALRALRDRTQQLMAAQPLVPDAKPRPIPPPTSVEQAAIIDDVRQYALNYSKSLPDFICTQVTRRYAARKPGTLHGGSADSDPYWQLADTLQIRLSYFQQKEDYKVILVNNSLVNKDYAEMGGSKSFGDFGSMMREVFEPSSEARFEWDHWGTLRGKRVMAFAYHIEQDRSQYRITVDDGKLSVVTAYHGLVEVDPDSHAIMRVTSEAEEVPDGFPVRSVKDVLDYDYTELSGHTFLLPLKARVDATFSDQLQRIDEEFRLYRKYSADSEITFDSETPPPLPDDKTKETPAVDCKDAKNATDPRCKK